MSIRELPDMWEKETYVGSRGEILWTSGDTCAKQLRAALPVWTRITEDPATWPEGLCMVMGNSGIPEVRQFYPGEWKNKDTYGYSKWRPLCDLDFPNE